jgi:opacity protein-like surface antigen
MKKLLLASALLLPFAAQAADLPPVYKAPVTSAVYGSPCTTAYCTGFYAGVQLDGNGTNADILGSGLDGSVFAGGAVLGAQAGWQYWNGTMFFGVEAGIGDQVNAGTSINSVGSNETGYLAYQELQAGGTLSGLFGGSPAINVPTALSTDLIALYAAVGVAERPFATGWETGAGAKFTFPQTTHVLLDIGYRYINYGTAQTGAISFNSENLIRVALSYKF